MEASAAVVDATGHMQIMCLDEWYKERMEELRASHAQDMEKMKTMIDELQTRITELEGNLTAMGSMAEGAHMCFNALLQVQKQEKRGTGEKGWDSVCFVDCFRSALRNGVSRVIAAIFFIEAPHPAVGFQSL